MKAKSSQVLGYIFAVARKLKDLPKGTQPVSVIYRQFIADGFIQKDSGDGVIISNMVEAVLEISKIFSDEGILIAGAAAEHNMLLIIQVEKFMEAYEEFQADAAKTG